MPSLYFAQGVPYVVVMTVAVIMFKRLGVGNAEIALYTSWLYLPYAIKPLWSPLVQRIGTRRGWVVVMQLLVAAGLACAALAIPTRKLSALERWWRWRRGGLLGDARRRGRRLLPARALQPPAGVVRRHSQHGLSRWR